jgi:hypothetical protein
MCSVLFIEIISKAIDLSSIFVKIVFKYRLKTINNIRGVYNNQFRYEYRYWYTEISPISPDAS